MASRFDIFAIIVLIISIIASIFFIISAIYYFNLMNLKPPSKAESTFLFWTVIVMAIIFIALAIYSIIKIFTYKGEPDVQIKTLPPVQQVQPVQPVQPVQQFQPIQQVQPVQQYQPVKQYTIPSNQSLSFSDIPLDQKGKNELDNELLNISSGMN